MMRFAEVFPSLEIGSTLSRQLAGSHFMKLHKSGIHVAV